jgi:hypothetical protein
MMVYTRLHENPEEEVGKVRLTVEAVGSVKGDGVDGEISVEVEEGAPKPTSWLHKSTLDVRHGLVGDEKHRGRSALAVDGSHR